MTELKIYSDIIDNNQLTEIQNILDIETQELLDIQKSQKIIINTLAELFKKANFTNKISETTLKTEDTGFEFEMAICITLGTPYNKPYKYSLDTFIKLRNRLLGLIPLFKTFRHNSDKHNPHDYTCSIDNTKHLSAKTNKSKGSIAPQVIGQPNTELFCKLLSIEYIDSIKLKEYMQNTTNGQPNISRILNIMVEHTFDCPILYYVDDKNTIRLITLINPINWADYEYEWSTKYADWNNSSTLRIKHKNKIVEQKILPTKGKKGKKILPVDVQKEILSENPTGKPKKEKNIATPGFISIAEFQFLSTRNNMINRWIVENFLTIFEDNFEIINF